MKPECNVKGIDGNVFALVGHATTALVQTGKAEEARHMQQRVWASRSYEEALHLVSTYVQLVEVE